MGDSDVEGEVVLAHTQRLCQMLAKSEGVDLDAACFAKGYQYNLLNINNLFLACAAEVAYERGRSAWCFYRDGEKYREMFISKFGNN